jgi:hypothetical protein
MAEGLHSPEFGWWVTGLVDGEGCFYAKLRFRTGTQAFLGKNGNRYPSFDFSCRLLVLLRADDAAVLDKLRDYFNVGYVRVRRSGVYKSGKSGSRPNLCAEFRVHRIGDLMQVVIPHFERYPLQSKKSKDYATWKRIVETAASLKGKRGWWKVQPERVEEINQMVTQLRDGRKFDPAKAHTKEQANG